LYIACSALAPMQRMTTMAEMFVAEMYLDFAVAARRARRIAALFDKATCVSRCPTGWGIHVSKEVLLRLRGQKLWRPPSRHANDESYEEMDEDERDELAKEVMQELAEDEKLFGTLDDSDWLVADQGEEDESASAEIFEEIQGETFSWARSDEDGWFYED